MKIVLIAAASAAMLVGPMSVMAQPGHGRPPPGLAKKPGGMPPGQAKKMWNRGENLPLSYLSDRSYHVDYNRYRLPPPPPGYRWVMVDGDAYLAQTTTGVIANIVRELLR